MRSALRAAVAASFVLFVLSGCGPGSQPLARVGNHTLTVDDLARLARGNEGGFPPAPDQARALALDQMVKRELLLHAALERGLDTTASALAFRRTTEEKLLLQALTAQLVPSDPGVSEAEIHALYRQRAVQYDVNLVYTTERPVVDLARAALAGGQRFARVADRYNAPGLLPQGGALGPMQPGTLPVPLDAAMQAQQVGVVGGPYAAAQGWFLLLVSRRSPARQDAYELEHEMLTTILRQRKQRATIGTALLDLEHAVHLEIAPDAAQTLFRLLTPARVPAVPHWIPDARERRRKLATFDGGAYTVDDMLGDMMRNDAPPPNAAMLPSLRSWIETRAMLRAELVEARRRHLDQEPANRRQFDAAISGSLVETEANAVLAGAPRPDEATVRAVWDRAKDANPQLSQVHIQWIVLPDTAKVQAIARGCRAGRSLRDAVRAVDPALHVQEQVVRFPGNDRAWAPLYAVLSSLKPGQWSGPDFMNDGWHVTQMIDKVQGPVAWEQLTPEMQHSVAGTVAQNAGVAHFNAYVDSLRRAVQPVLFTENLHRLPWPVPAPIEIGP